MEDKVKALVVKLSKDVEALKEYQNDRKAYLDKEGITGEIQSKILSGDTSFLSNSPGARRGGRDHQDIGDILAPSR